MFEPTKYNKVHVFNIFFASLVTCIHLKAIDQNADIHVLTSCVTGGGLVKNTKKLDPRLPSCPYRVIYAIFYSRTKWQIILNLDVYTCSLWHSYTIKFVSMMFHNRVDCCSLNNKVSIALL